MKEHKPLARVKTACDSLGGSTTAWRKLCLDPPAELLLVFNQLVELRMLIEAA